MVRKVYKFLIETPKYIEIVKKKKCWKELTQRKENTTLISLHVWRPGHKLTPIGTLSPTNFIFYITDSRKYNFVY